MMDRVKFVEDTIAYAERMKRPATFEGGTACTYAGVPKKNIPGCLIGFRLPPKMSQAADDVRDDFGGGVSVHALLGMDGWKKPEGWDKVHEVRRALGAETDEDFEFCRLVQYCHDSSVSSSLWKKRMLAELRALLDRARAEVRP